MKIGHCDRSPRERFARAPMIGAALVTTIRSGLLVLQIGNFWLQLFLGLILLFAVFVDRYRSVYAERRSTRQR